MKKSKYRLYERGLGWVQYDEATYLELRRERTRTCMRMRRQKRCLCSKKDQWRCDGFCDGCIYLKVLEVSLISGIAGGIPAEICKELSDNDVVGTYFDFVVKYVLWDDVFDWERDIKKCNV